MGKMYCNERIRIETIALTLYLKGKRKKKIINHLIITTNCSRATAEEIVGKLFSRRRIRGQEISY